MSKVFEAITDELTRFFNNDTCDGYVENDTVAHTGLGWGYYDIMLRKDATYQPYVVAFLLDLNDLTWAQGHYFETLEEAMQWLWEKKCESELVAPL